MTTNPWEKLLNLDRRRTSNSQAGASDTRTEAERDYDRILFSSAVRRLANKTQVFPLDNHDSVRTRLTHSYEVSNLARSIGMGLVYGNEEKLAADICEAQRNIPAILAAVGLAHDLGNPPFGHQGEAAIRAWFNRQKDSEFKNLDDVYLNDFLFFDGNAQSLRLLVRLHLLDDEFGLNLTFATLAASMKYTTDSSSVDEKNALKKKPGYFRSEERVVEDVLREVGLEPGRRHPLAYIMEACDDIAYSILDVEDAVKKSLMSYSDVVSSLSESSDQLIKDVLEEAEKKHKEYKKKYSQLSSAELGDISMQRLRVAAISGMVGAVRGVFFENQSALIAGSFDSSLIEKSKAKEIVALLKNLANQHAYQHRSVVEVELAGWCVIQDLMDMLWFGITDRKKNSKLGDKRLTPFGRYVYSRISENYRHVFESEKNGLPTLYKEAQLLTDMVSGMTDSFMMALHGELKKFRDQDSDQAERNRTHKKN